MKQTEGVGARKPVTRAILATVIILIGFLLGGCGEQMARIEDQQVRLQAMVEAHTEQLAAITARIEENQDALQAGLEDLRNTVQQVEAQATAVSQSAGRLAAEQIKMQEAAKNSSRQMTGRVAALEQSLGVLTESQHELKAGIENVQNDARTRASDIASDIATVAAEQARLSEAVENNARQLADNAAMIEQDRLQWQTTIAGLQENIQQVTVAMNALGEDLSELQQALQQNVRELVSMIEASGQSTGRLEAEQLKLREKTEASLRALDDSLNALKQKQDKLQSQVNDVQNTAETIGRDVPEALAKFADELARMGIKERAEIEDTEPSSSSPPAEANGVE